MKLEMEAESTRMAGQTGKGNGHMKLEAKSESAGMIGIAGEWA